MTVARVVRLKAAATKYSLRIATGVLSLGVMALIVSPLIFTPEPAQALPNGLAVTPPLGWNDYYSFGCDPTDQLIRTTADAMVSSGMAAAGYQYVNIDDCWASRNRDRQGNLVPDPRKFPHGMKPLVDYVHAKGLKIGIYTSAGRQTCAGRPGILGYEQQDIDLFASWGFDFVKVDWCNAEGVNAEHEYGIIRDAIKTATDRTGRPMFFSICNWGEQTPWVWGPRTGHMWRTWYDISWYKDTEQYKTEDHWGDVLRNLDKNSAHAPSAGPGAWNDPDILQVGVGTLTPTQERSHFSLWAILAAPLLAGNDIRTMPEYIREMFTHEGVLAINQDPLGVQGIKVSEDDGLQVWSKKLQGQGSRAVALFNRRAEPATITAHWPALGLTGSASVHDVWARQDLGSFTDAFAAQVPAHGVVLLRLQGTESNTPVVLALSSGVGQSESTVNDSSIGTVAWQNPWDAFTSNDLSAYVTLQGQQQSHYLKATSFKLAVPDNSTVTGIKVDIEGRSTNGINTDNSVVLIKNGVPVGRDKGDRATPWPKVDTYRSYGEANDLWETTWTPEDINGKHFGVQVSMRNDTTPTSGSGRKPGSGTPDTSYLDNVRITVFYTLPVP